MARNPGDHRPRVDLPNPPAPTPAQEAVGTGSPAGEREPTTIRFPQVAVGFVLGLIIPVVMMVAWLLGSHALGADASLGFAGTPVAVVLGCGLLWWWLRRCRVSRADLGFTRLERSPWHLLWLTPAVIGLSAITAATLGPALGLTPSARSDNDLAPLGLGWPVLVPAAVTTCVLVPLLEETLYRGLLFRWALPRLGTPITVVAVGTLFGLSHVAPAVLVYIIPAGIGLTAVRAWYRSTWGSVVVHVANNTLVTAIAATALTSG